MAGNSIGQLFRVTTFGESHGAGIGVVIDGCPAGLLLDIDFIKRQLNRRKPGQSKITTTRNESEDFEILSGIYELKTTGAPLAFFIRNEDTKSKDYSHLEHNFRPGHADFTYEMKYGIRDYRGGGRSSARETAARVIAGSIAALILKENRINITAFVSSVGKIDLEKEYNQLDLNSIDGNIVRCPDAEIANQMISLIEETKKSGDTIGGVISCVIKNVPIGLGEPVFDKLQADLAKAMMSINAAKGFEIGDGFQGAQQKGSEQNDIFLPTPMDLLNTKTKSNHSGGIQGGISNGQDILFKVAFKPVSTVMMEQQSVDDQGNEVMLDGKGRHDPCVVPRAVPIVEAMAAIILVDHFLRNKTAKI
jgi:chorismate synthase